MTERYVPSARVHVFERSAHFPCHEEPEDYADVISRFVMEHAS